MGMRGRRTRWFGAGAVALLALAGCSGSGSSGDGGASTSDAERTATTTVPVAHAGVFGAPGIAVIAHRGASGSAPEHTFAAYDMALTDGADYLEQDLQLTKDGELVVLHDPTLDRTASGPAADCTGAVADKTAAQLEQCEVGGWFDPDDPEASLPVKDGPFVGAKIPTLASVFDRYGAKARYYIEVKAPDEQPGIEDALLDLLDDADLADPAPGLPPVVIQSFSADSLQRIHERRPDLPLVLLIAGAAQKPDDAALADIAEYAVAVGPAAAMVDEAFVDAANAHCLDVHPYTVNDEAEMTSLLDAGVGGMFTNVPDRLDTLRPDDTAEVCS